MNVGELKVANFFSNTNLQLNKELLVSNESTSSFDNILKEKSNYVDDANPQDRYKNLNNSTMNRDVKKFDSKRQNFQREDDKTLKENIKDGIAKNKLNNEKGGLNELREQLKDQVEALNALKEKIAEMDLPEDEVLKLVEDETIMSEIAALMGIDLEALVQLFTAQEVSEELVDEISNLMELELIAVEDVKELMETVELVLPEETAEKFEAVFEKVVEALPENAIKPELVQTTEVEAKVEQAEVVVEPEMVKTEVVKQTDQTQVSSTEIVTDEKVEVEIVKEQQTEQQEMTSKEEKPMILSKKVVQTETTNTFEEQVNLMKSENSLITSAKVEPKTMLARSVMNQVVQGAKMSINMSDQGSEILIKLNPKNLGNVALKMAFDKGQLLAEIQVENQTVKGIIESNLEDLKSALKDEGYSIGDLDVSVSKDNDKGQQEQSFTNHFKKQFKQETFEEVEERLLAQSNLVNDQAVDYLA